MINGTLQTASDKVNNTLNLAKTWQSQLEKSMIAYREFSDMLGKAEKVMSITDMHEEPAISLPGVLLNNERLEKIKQSLIVSIHSLKNTNSKLSN